MIMRLLLHAYTKVSKKAELIPCDVDKLTNAIIICMEGIVIQSKINQLTFQKKPK